MDKYQKFGLGVVAFVTTAACARAVGWYEMKDQCEKKIAVLQERIDRDQHTYYLARQDYSELLKYSTSQAQGDFEAGVSLGVDCALHPTRFGLTPCKDLDAWRKTLKEGVELTSKPPKTETWRLQ